ncbi:MAG: hypothetical protein KatS3mg012_1322 [Gaiellaceae bacterium]|nr:MAG: hypothetical protein KatS3mg012_1322 [Gaiellaceae bacterium]
MLARPVVGHPGVWDDERPRGRRSPRSAGGRSGRQRRRLPRTRLLICPGFEMPPSGRIKAAPELLLLRWSASADGESGYNRGPGAVSSVGRAPARQAGGHWFEPSTAHSTRPARSALTGYLASRAVQVVSPPSRRSRTFPRRGPDRIAGDNVDHRGGRYERLEAVLPDLRIRTAAELVSELAVKRWHGAHVFPQARPDGDRHVPSVRAVVSAADGAVAASCHMCPGRTSSPSPAGRAALGLERAPQ